MGQVLDGQLTDLEVGAFCLAMRIKGETPAEMAGFLDALRARAHAVPTGGHTAVVLPSYNGARKLPVLTPLLALLLAREGLPVLVHGQATENSRVLSQDVLAALGVPVQTQIAPLQAGQVQFVPTGLLHPGLQRLLDVRRVVGLRNPAHAMVKLYNPCEGAAVVVGSYTHPEYAVSMAETLRLMGSTALLLRGTEGEPVADPRRTPAMDGFHAGQLWSLQTQQAGPLARLPDLPAIDVTSTATWCRAVLDGQQPLPEPLRLQVAHILHVVRLSRSTA